MKNICILASATVLAAICSCSTGGEDYDTGYDTSNPYGVPQGSDPYQAVNPPADPTYGAAAYESSAPAGPAAPAAPISSPTSHTVTKGDTLWSLSKKYDVSVSALRTANGIASGDSTIRIGQTLQVPGQ